MQPSAKSLPYLTDSDFVAIPFTFYAHCAWYHTVSAREMSPNYFCQPNTATGAILALEYRKYSVNIFWGVGMDFWKSQRQSGTQISLNTNFL